MSAPRLAWIALASGPAAAALTEMANYLLGTMWCGGGGRSAMFMIVAAALAVALGGMALAWRVGVDSPAAFESGRARALRTTPFVASLALWLNVFSAVVIVAMSIPPLVLHDCR
jgi:hypothetical protein